MVISAEQCVVAIFMKTRDEVRHFYWIFSQNSPKLALTWSLVSTRQNFQHNFQLFSFFLHGFILSIIPFSIIESLSYISWLSCTVPPLLNYLVLFGWLMILWHCIILYIVRHCRSFGKWSEACAERINRLEGPTLCQHILLLWLYDCIIGKKKCQHIHIEYWSMKHGAYS